MLRIERAEKKLIRLKKSALAEAEQLERQLQNMICANADAFCEELGEKLVIIGQEVRPSEVIPDRIDILAVDESGAAVIIELKRGSHKLQLLQAISYAGMIARWEPEQFVETLASECKQGSDEAQAIIGDHVGADVSTINTSQRVLLIAEDFDPALLISAEWLHEHFDVDIRCYRLQLSQENGSEYLTCTCIYPPIEIASMARRTTLPGSRDPAWTDWAGALKPLANSDERQFFEAELVKHQKNRLRYRELIYDLGGKRRFWVAGRLEHAYVRQRGRFDGDEAFWRSRLSKPDTLAFRHQGRSLRFSLITADDFRSFRAALDKELKRVEFVEAQESNGDEGED